jgi:undecaprenyl-diphosphatase
MPLTFEADPRWFFAADTAWLTPATALAALGMFAVLVVLLLSLVPLLLWVVRPVVRALDYVRVLGRDALHLRGADRWPRLLRMLERDAVELLVLAGAGCALLASAAALVWLGFAVSSGAPVVEVDRAVVAGLQAWRQDWLDVAMVSATEFGGARITVAVAVAVFCWLAWRRAWAAAAYWVGALVGARVCVMVLKLVFERSRPASIYGGLESFSFPSGHATSSMVTYGFLAFLLCVGQRWRVRVPVIAFTVVLVTLIGLSRLYLGMHWLSDVAAGYALGLAWIALLGSAYLALHRPERLAPLPLATIAAAAAVAAAVWIALYRFPATLDRYRDAVTALTAAPAFPASPAVPALRTVAAMDRAPRATPAADRSCDGRCRALRSDSPPSR